MSGRLETLHAMLAESPGNTFARYALAMEYANAGEFARAVEEYRRVLAANAEYAAAYYHGGQALERLGRVEEARAMYEKGIEVTSRNGDGKTRNELQAALDMLPL